MWALLSRRLRRWLFFVVGLPIIARILSRGADAVQERRGEQSRLAGGLRKAGNLAGRGRRGRRRRRRR